MLANIWTVLVLPLLSTQLFKCLFVPRSAVSCKLVLFIVDCWRKKTHNTKKRHIKRQWVSRPQRLQWCTPWNTCMTARRHPLENRLLHLLSYWQWHEKHALPSIDWDQQPNNSFCCCARTAPIFVAHCGITPAESHQWWRSQISSTQASVSATELSSPCTVTHIECISLLTKQQTSENMCILCLTSAYTMFCCSAAAHFSALAFRQTCFMHHSSATSNNSTNKMQTTLAFSPDTLLFCCHSHTSCVLLQLVCRWLFASRHQCVW